mgnify:CR=1 FL=1
MNALISCTTAGLLLFSLNGCALDRGLSPPTGGEHVSMTATDLTTNNTSEFAAAIAAVFLNTAPAAAIPVI